MTKSQSLLSKHAKSFNWAGFFLPKETFNKCSILYDFCRTIDDIADTDNDLYIRKKNLLKFRSDFRNKNYSNNIIKNIYLVLNKDNISYKIIDDLFDGIESDLKKKVEITTQKDLLIYSYRVAGTVGLMMAKILKVKDNYSLKCAIDLGIAMQLTNIARDVVEDKKKGRFYINHNFDSIKETIDVAETFYDSAFLAIKSIPIISRFSIIVARRVYKKIGNKILKQKNLENYNNSGKIYISNFGKIVETFLSFYDLLKLFFISSKVHLKHNEYKILNEEINIDDKI
jgi:phytoene synthase